MGQYPQIPSPHTLYKLKTTSQFPTAVTTSLKKMTPTYVRESRLRDITDMKDKENEVNQYGIYKIIMTR